MNEQTRIRRFLKALLGRQGGEVALALLALLGLYFFVYRGGRFFLVPSASMEPTLLKGDYIVTLKARTYDRGDIVVLQDPEHAGDYIVKRIVGVGGDVVEVSGGAVHVNGAYVSEPYVAEPAHYTLPPATVPEGCVLLLGDNRNDSDDSHLWKQPAQPVTALIGQVRFIYYPYSRAGVVPRHHPVMAAPDLLQPEAQ